MWQLREQILLCFEGSAPHICGGINIINTTNLDYFSQVQKAELFRLKGWAPHYCMHCTLGLLVTPQHTHTYHNHLHRPPPAFLPFHSSFVALFGSPGVGFQKLGHEKEALEFYSLSCQLCPSYSRSWLTWGHYCFDSFKAALDKQKSDALTDKASHDIDSDRAGDKSEAEAATDTLAHLATSATICILKAVECDSVPARMLLRRGECEHG